jgi:hypothetical protein
MPALVDLYLHHRAAKGFNLILVNLLEHKFSTQPPKLRDGTPPFAIKGDFATPNEPCFHYAEEIAGKAARRGIVLLLCAPSILETAAGSETSVGTGPGGSSANRPSVNGVNTP